MKSYLIIPMFLSCVIFMMQDGYSQTYHKNPGTSTSMHHRQLPPQMDEALPGTSGSSLSSGTTSGDYLGPEGSMYFNDQWQQGRVLLADNSMIDDVELRYNVYYKQMQFILDGDTAAFGNPDELRYLMLEDKKFIHADYLSDGHIGNDYFQVLAEGECMLLNRNLVKYHETISKRECIEEKFIKGCELYIKQEGEPARFIKCNKRSICNALSDCKEEVEQFIRDNDIKLKTQDDLVTVIDFYNSLKKKETQPGA